MSNAEEKTTKEVYPFFKTPDGKSHVFSNWYKCDVIIDSVKYVCVEQYMMAQKAKLFKDEQIYREIMTSNSPRTHKRLGRKVRNFNGYIWEKYRFDIVFRANLAKFKLNEDLKKELLATGDKIIAESSPYDRIWGTGRAIDHKWAKNPDKWFGKNLLGKCLMLVRDRLRVI